MDASEIDLEARLYKASAELLNELQAKLPLLVKKPDGHVRKWVLAEKVVEICRLLDRFQEWPQLLDTCLAALVQVLADAFLQYCGSHSKDYLHQHDGTRIYPVPRAISHVIYALCKVRGQKIIVRLLNNEPKYVETLLSCFETWNSTEGSSRTRMSWEEQYVLLLWLSHLMLAPFELASISALAHQKADFNSDMVTSELPPVAQSLLRIALEHFRLPSKASEAACTLAVRLALRRDMQALSLPANLIQWSIRQLKNDDNSTTSYDHLGLLSLLYGLNNSASDSEAAPFMIMAFNMVQQLARSDSPHCKRIQDSAPARKFIIKIMRTTVLHVISLASRHSHLVRSVDVDAMLEECIQSMLEYLADKDTPVRLAASKALSLVALNLDSAMSAQVVEAVIDSLNENVLIQETLTGRLMPMTDMPMDEASKYRKNVNAVNPLQWHGAMLTLGHLLFRRSPPIHQLPTIIEALMLGLEFEQRSNVGTSIGVGVRDAACFGLWSLARKYSTVELTKLTVPLSLSAHGPTDLQKPPGNVIQLIANKLVVSACLDPSGNLRRGSSAALQELIGRHPDVVIQGIPVVQVVDYHAIARRSRAMIDVASGAADLDLCYRYSLIYAITYWRGARSTDADSRRTVLSALQILLKPLQHKEIEVFLAHLMTEITSLRPSNIGSNAAARHGLLNCLTAVVVHLTVSETSNSHTQILSRALHLLDNYNVITGSTDGRVTTEVENVLEAAALLISSVAKLRLKLLASSAQLQSEPHWSRNMFNILERCTTASDNEQLCQQAAQANQAVFELCTEGIRVTQLQKWLYAENQKKSEYTCRGRIMTLSKIYNLVANFASFESSIRDIAIYFHSIVKGEASIEIKQIAMQNIPSSWVSFPSHDEWNIYRETIEIGLLDYSSDQRGDVGSLLRLASIEQADATMRYHPANGIASEIVRPHTLRLAQLVSRLAAEKLVKVRFRAWLCLVAFLPQLDLSDESEIQVQVQSDVSTFAYYENLLRLTLHDTFANSIYRGLISSAAGGTEDISRASTEALTSYMLDQSDVIRTRQTREMLRYLIHYCFELQHDDDKDIAAGIDFLAFLLEQIVPLSAIDSLVDDEVATVIWKGCQRVHLPSSTISRLEALIRLYTAMMVMKMNNDHLKRQATDRLTRMLLHRWPKIRGAAADALWFAYPTQSVVMAETDWNSGVGGHKSMVAALRKSLPVVKQTVSRV